MRMRTIAMLALMATAMVSAVLPGGANGGKTTSTNVTAIIHDTDGTGALLRMRSDGYNGSGQATYTSNSSGSTSLGSTILNGEWELSFQNQSVRTLWITPNDAAGAQPAGPPASYYWQGTHSGSRCFDQNGNTVPLENILTSSGNCKLGVNFNSAGTLYKLLMSPFPFNGPGDGTPVCPSIGCPATGLATVTCNKVNNGTCVSWTILPNTSAPNANVANLYRYAPQGRTITWVYIGQYYQSFRIDLTNP